MVHVLILTRTHCISAVVASAVGPVSLWGHAQLQTTLRGGREGGGTSEYMRWGREGV